MELVYTLNQWRLVLNKGICEEEPFVGKHTTVADGKLLIEGRDFYIRPTAEECRALTEKLLKSIDEQIVRGFHPWQFTGCVEIDDRTVLYATTRQDGRSYILELKTYGKGLPYWKHEIFCLHRIAASKKDISVRIKCLFSLMSHICKKNCAVS